MLQYMSRHSPDKKPEPTEREIQLVRDDHGPKINGRNKEQNGERRDPERYGDWLRVVPRKKRSTRHPGCHKNEDQPADDLADEVLRANGLFAGATPAALHKEAQDRNKLKPLKRLSALRTPRPATDDPPLKKELVGVVP